MFSATERSGHQVELLVDHADAQRLRFVGRGEGDLLAGHPDAARVCVVRTGQDLHQGGLARPVLTHDGVDLASADGQGHVVERLDAREALADARHLEDRPRVVRLGPGLGTAVPTRLRSSGRPLWALYAYVLGYWANETRTSRVRRTPGPVAVS